MKKLNSQEIDRVVARIREEYDHYIVHFAKTPERKRAFEDRWREALRQGSDLTLFLGVEIQVVKELLLEAKREIETEPKPEIAKVKPKSYADRVIEEMQRKIQGYPRIGLPEHPERSPDVDKLYGAIDWFSRQVWPHVYSVLRSKDPDARLSSLDQELTTLVPWEGRLPKELEAYVELYRSGAISARVAKAQNRCLWLGAAFFHRVSDRLGDAVDKAENESWALENPNPGELELMRRTHALVKRVLEDFRLKELKPRDAAPSWGKSF